jgi:hypothetical protein
MLICDSTRREHSPVTSQSILRERVSHKVQVGKSKVTLTKSDNCGVPCFIRVEETDAWYICSSHLVFAFAS